MSDEENRRRQPTSDKAGTNSVRAARPRQQLLDNDGERVSATRTTTATAISTWVRRGRRQGRGARDVAEQSDLPNQPAHSKPAIFFARGPQSLPSQHLHPAAKTPETRPSVAQFSVATHMTCKIHPTTMSVTSTTIPAHSLALSCRVLSAPPPPRPCGPTLHRESPDLHDFGAP